MTNFLSSLLQGQQSGNPLLSPLMAALLQQPLVQGMLKPGNVDLQHRPIVRNLDGSISTVRSITVTDNHGHAYLIPTVVGNRVVSNQAALRNFQRTGQHLGYFVNENAADQYAQTLHENQAREYLPQAGRFNALGRR